jgi:predicted enzyme related to lactoylglutathione lyase
MPGKARHPEGGIASVAPGRLIDSQRADFVSVPVSDLDRATKFYGETLGLERSRGYSERWREFELGNVSLALIPIEMLGRSELTPNTAPIALRVSDVAEAREKLEAAGVDFPMETIDSGVCLIAPFRDPDGNALQLHRRYAPFADGSRP